jgi:hypothetical protein
MSYPEESSTVESLEPVRSNSHLHKEKCFKLGNIFQTWKHRPSFSVCFRCSAEMDQTTAIRLIRGIRQGTQGAQRHRLCPGTFQAWPEFGLQMSANQVQLHLFSARSMLVPCSAPVNRGTYQQDWVVLGVKNWDLDVMFVGEVGW